MLGLISTLAITDAHTFKRFNMSKCLLHRTIKRCQMHDFAAVAELLVCSCDLDPDPMTLIYELDLDILKTYLHTNNELSRTRLTDRQTDRQRQR